MSIGINVTDEIHVSLWELKERLLRDLDRSNLVYQIPFDKLNKHGIKETIVQIPDLDTEISVQNDIIKYIRSGATKYSTLDVMVAGEEPLDHIDKTKKALNDMFGSEYNIRVERINTSSMNMAVMLKSKEIDEGARLQILMDSNMNIYINTIMAL